MGPGEGAGSVRGGRCGFGAGVPQEEGGHDFQTLFLTDRVCKCYVRKVI